MINQCRYCSQDTAGNHKFNCPNNSQRLGPIICYNCKDLTEKLKKVETERNIAESVAERLDKKLCLLILEQKKLIAANIKLTERIEVLEDIRKWYANPCNWMTYQNYPEKESKAVKDKGQYARSAKEK